MSNLEPLICAVVEIGRLNYLSFGGSASRLPIVIHRSNPLQVAESLCSDVINVEAVRRTWFRHVDYVSSRPFPDSFVLAGAGTPVGFLSIDLPREPGRRRYRQWHNGNQCREDPFRARSVVEDSYPRSEEAI